MYVELVRESFGYEEGDLSWNAAPVPLQNVYRTWWKAGGAIPPQRRANIALEEETRGNGEPQSAAALPYP